MRVMKMPQLHKGNCHCINAELNVSLHTNTHAALSKEGVFLCSLEEKNRGEKTMKAIDIIKQVEKNLSAKIGGKISSDISEVRIPLYLCAGLEAFLFEY